MPKKITLLEKELQMINALKDPSVSNQRLLAKRIGVSTPTVNGWLADSVAAQIKLSENKRVARRKRVAQIIKDTEAMIAKGMPAYRAAALAGVAYDTYSAYKRELTGQSC